MIKVMFYSYDGCLGRFLLTLSRIPAGRVLPYLGYICMCGPKGDGSSAVLVKNRVSISVS